MKVLHVLANSPPDVNGYAVRTHGLMKAYSELPNIEVVGLTSPWYPDRESLIEMLELDEITYHRCLHPARMKEIRGVGMKWTASRGKDKIAGSEGFAKKPTWKKIFQLASKPLRPGWSWIEERIIFKHFTKRIVTNTIVGNDPQVILDAAHNVLENGGKAGRIPDLWDGKTAARIADIIEDTIRWIE